MHLALLTIDLALFSANMRDTLDTNSLISFSPISATCFALNPTKASLHNYNIIITRNIEQ